MATIQELSKNYAQRILNAINQDGFKTYTKLTPSMMNNSNSLIEIKKIKSEIDKLTYSDSGKIVTYDIKQDIYNTIQKELNLPSHYNFSESVYKASNDEITTLIDMIDKILKGK